MGFGNLVLADCPSYDPGRVSTMAVHAFDVYERAERFDSLETALSGLSLSAGFSRRLGEKRKSHSLELGEFAASFARNPIAPAGLVFGNEKSGLSDKEIQLCSLAVHIPTSEWCPSLNVAQAVQIACFELRDFGPPSAGIGTDTATRSLIEEEVGSMLDELRRLGFFRKSDDSYAGRFLRDICERAGLREDEVRYLSALLKKASAVAEHPSPRSRK